MVQVFGDAVPIDGPDAISAAHPLTRRHVFAATIGNALEFYDFITYGFFAIQIGHAFFPAGNAYASLMLSLATFGAGFLTRPLGGLLIGIYADRVGRRPAMMLSFMMMGASIAALALLPTYAEIGVAAPVLAVLARMVQGFSLGGEVGPTTAYLLESAAVEKRGLIVSWQGASQAIATATAGLVGVVLATNLSAAALDSYGWRIALLLGAAILPFGLWVRRNLPETLHAHESHPATQTTAETGLAIARENMRIIVLGLLLLASGAVSTQVFNYFTTFAQNTLHLAGNISFAATVTFGGVASIAVLCGGALSDRLGRRPLIISGQFAALVLTYPVFSWIVTVRSATALLAGVAILAVSAVGAGAVQVAITESLPKRIRGSAFAVIYATAIGVFGGSTQLVITWLIHVTGSPLAPAWVLFGATTVGLGTVLFLRESAPARRVHSAA